MSRFIWKSDDGIAVAPQRSVASFKDGTITLRGKLYQLARLPVQTVANLRQIVSNFKKRTEPVYVFDDINQGQRQPKLLPPIGLGHLKDPQTIFMPSDKPNVGEVVKLWLEGNVIKGDLIRVPKQICDLIESGSYSKVSVELWPWPPGKFLGEGWMLKRVALLGADVPAVYSLESIPMPDSKAGVIRGVELFEVGTHNGTTYTLDDLKDIVNNYWLNRPDNETIAASLRQYLKRDAERKLSDGASAKEHADRKETVFVFRDLSNVAVDYSRGEGMNAADIRAALVSAGILTQEDADLIPDAVIVKFAPLVQPKANADTKPAEPAKPEACADEGMTETTPPTKKEGDEEKVMSYKDAQALIQASVAKFLKPTSDKLAALEKTNAAKTAKALRAEAVAFCDSLKSKQTLSHGMNKDGILVDLLVEADSVPGEFTFSDGAGKAAKGTLGDKLREFLGRIPKFSDYTEKHGGKGGEPAKDAKEQEAHENALLTAAFNSFNDEWKNHFKSADNYIAGYRATKKHVDRDLTVEEYLKQIDG